MFELLPKTRIASAKRAYMFRYAAAGLWVIGLAGFAWAIVLAPSTYVAWLRVRSLDAMQDQEHATDSEYVYDEYASASDVIALVSAVASSSIPHPTAALDAVDATVGPITTEAVDLSLDPETLRYTLTYRGIAPTRTEVVAFADRLRATGLFTDVDVPLSSLVKERDVVFTLTASHTNTNYNE